MSHDPALTPAGLWTRRWPLVRLGTCFTHNDKRSVTGKERLLSVTKNNGVVPRDLITDKEPRAESLVGYKLCRQGDLVVNQMSVYDGLLGIAPMDGLVTYHYLVFRPTAAVDARYFSYLLRTDLYRGDFSQRVRGLGDSSQSNVRTPHIRIGDFLQTIVPLPSLEEQRRIADFLDDQVTRIDHAIQLRQREVDLVEDRRRASLAEMAFPQGCDLVPLGSRALVQLGRQRSPWNETGDFMTPYLRSANIVDGRVLMHDVKEMNFDPDERARFALRRGDVLVTEGAGSPESVGASAVYEGPDGDLVCFQNTVVRLRPRATIDGEYLAWWARASHAAGAMRSFATGANILHIGAEGIRRMKMPVMPLSDQVEAARRCSIQDHAHRAVSSALTVQAGLLSERKRSLITAAVTGELDVATASARAADQTLSGSGVSP